MRNKLFFTLLALILASCSKLTQVKRDCVHSIEEDAKIHCSKINLLEIEYKCTKPAKTYRITFSDSGIGGYIFAKDIAIKLQRELKNLGVYYNTDFIFEHIADKKNFPFSSKSDNELRKIVFELIEKQTRKKDTKLAILACNTAGTVVMKDETKAINIVKKTKEHLSSLKFGTILVVATNKTIDSNVYNIEGKKMLFMKASWLAGMIENKEPKHKIKKAVFAHLDYLKETQPELFNDITNVALLCTHFPATSDAFREYFGSNMMAVNIITQGNLFADFVLEKVKKDLKEEDINSCAGKIIFESNVKYLLTK